MNILLLPVGRRSYQVDYFQQGLAKSLTVKWEGPGILNQIIPANVLYH